MLPLQSVQRTLCAYPVLHVFVFTPCSTLYLLHACLFHLSCPTLGDLGTRERYASRPSASRQGGSFHCENTYYLLLFVFLNNWFVKLIICISVLILDLNSFIDYRQTQPWSLLRDCFIANYSHF